MTQTKVCPFCAESIPADASKCTHCGEFLGPPARESVLDAQLAIDQMPVDETIDDFWMAYLRGTELSGAYLSGADLFAANLAAADLSGADLGGANLGNADLSRADLSGANLVAADLSDAHLRGADLRGANLIGADLSGAVYDDCTLWPDDFDPESAGAIRAIGGR